jgi:hypothetical protein
LPPVFLGCKHIHPPPPPPSPPIQLYVCMLCVPFFDLNLGLWTDASRKNWSRYTPSHKRLTLPNNGKQCRTNEGSVMNCVFPCLYTCNFNNIFCFKTDSGYISMNGLQSMSCIVKS